MKLIDCEVSHRHIRGHNVAFIFGHRALSDAERAELLAEWHKAYGPDATPAYASPAGWQNLAEQSAAGPLASRFSFDEAAEVVICDGNKFSAPLFDALAQETEPGYWLRVVRIDGGVVTMMKQSEESIRASAPAGDDSDPAGIESLVAEKLDAALSTDETKMLTGDGKSVAETIHDQAQKEPQATAATPVRKNSAGKKAGG